VARFRRTAAKAGGTETTDGKPMKTVPTDTRKARLHFPDGTVIHYDDPMLANLVWQRLPKGVRAAFRSANDTRRFIRGIMWICPKVTKNHSTPSKFWPGFFTSITKIFHFC